MPAVMASMKPAANPCELVSSAHSQRTGAPSLGAWWYRVAARAVPNVFASGPLGPLTPDQAFVLPVIMLGARKPLETFVLGVNPYLRPDDSYTAFRRDGVRSWG